MVIPNSFLVIAACWLIILLLDKKFKSSRFGVQYNEILQRWGITISTAHIQFKTTFFNRMFTKVGRLSPHFLSLWFNVGIIFGTIFLIATLPLLVYFMYKSYREPDTKQMLQPVMPGVNLPWNQLNYYILTLIITGAFHEVGHAVAATRENVKINSFGFFILLLYPGAFVELNTVQLEIISPLKRLRIYTAGVWHNFVLAIMSLSLISVLPYLLSPFYTSNQGVVVTWIDRKFTLSAKLQSGSVIKSVNRCPVFSIRNWYSCLQKIQVTPVDGYCNSLTFVKTLNSSLPYLSNNNFNELDCCNDTSTYRFCYYYDRYKPSLIQRKINSTVLTLNSFNLNVAKEKSDNKPHLYSRYREHACLPARLAMSFKLPCNNNTDCNINTLCLKPLVTKFTRIVRIAHSRGQDILFVGDPRELSSYVMVSDYIPKHFFISPNFPGQLSLLFKYLFSISSALAVLNMVPCSYLDGHQALCMLLLIIFPRSSTLRPKIERLIVIFGTFMLCFVLLSAFYSLFIDGIRNLF